MDKDSCAFPTNYKNNDGTDDYERGITKRQYFIGVALQGLMVKSIPGSHNLNTGPNNKEIVKHAIDIADELIKQLSDE